jgi:hypothetical protein
MLFSMRPSTLDSQYAAERLQQLRGAYAVAQSGL